MKFKMGPLTISQGTSTGEIYISPEINGDDLKTSWAMWVWPDGSADIYLKRKEEGVVLGKPIRLPAPSHEHTFAEQFSKKFRPCLGCGREYRLVSSKTKE